LSRYSTVEGKDYIRLWALGFRRFETAGLPLGGRTGS
jgi:hypothetical protein